MAEDVLVPIVLFGSLVAIVWLISAFNQRKRQTIHETIRLAIERGQELSPKMIRDMSMINNPRISDLRRGVVLIALSAAFILVALINSREMHELLSISVFPGLIGLAFIALWRFGYDNSID